MFSGVSEVGLRMWIYAVDTHLDLHIGRFLKWAKEQKSKENRELNLYKKKSKKVFFPN